MNQVVKTPTPGEIMETVLIKGDLSKLEPHERMSYYKAVCESVGLNALTTPFAYITLNGKLQLYALKACTDQLRSIHDISVTDLTKETIDGVHIVTAKVQNAKGRTDADIGAVNIAGLKGEAFANAVMKASTKAKRRATLSICGLGMLDETEVDDLPASQKDPVERPRVPSPSDAPPKSLAAPVLSPEPVIGHIDETKPHKIVGGTFASWTDAYIAAVQSAGEPAVVMAWVDVNQPQLDKLAKGSPTDFTKVGQATAKHLEFLRKTAPTTVTGSQGEVSSGGETALEPAKPATKARKAAKEEPAFLKDYDGWLKFFLERIAIVDDAERLEDIFVQIDEKWSDLMPPDKESLLAARREAEARLEQ